MIPRGHAYAIVEGPKTFGVTGVGVMPDTTLYKHTPHVILSNLVAIGQNCMTVGKEFQKLASAGDKGVAYPKSRLFPYVLCMPELGLLKRYVYGDPPEKMDPLSRHAFQVHSRLSEPTPRYRSIRYIIYDLLLVIQKPWVYPYCFEIKGDFGLKCSFSYSRLFRPNALAD